MAQLYDALAPEYDIQMTALGYNLPDLAVETFVHRCEDPPNTVLDAGAGTGILGSLLAAAGITCTLGFDLSAGMLAVAHSRGVYGSLVQADLRHPPFAAFSMDAIFCIGVLDHVGPDPSILANLVRLLRVGGLLVASLEGALQNRVQTVLEELVAAQMIATVELLGPFQGLAGSAHPERDYLVVLGKT
ncbi:MAG: class I SAM-dependent DNA methyltransferase [Gammaproteobacteria bacterium]